MNEQDPPSAPVGASGGAPTPVESPAHARRNRIQYGLLWAHLAVYAVFCWAVDPFDITVVRRLLALGMRELPSDSGSESVAIVFVAVFVAAASVPIGLLTGSIIARRRWSLLIAPVVSALLVTTISAIVCAIASNGFGTLPVTAVASLAGSAVGYGANVVLERRVGRRASRAGAAGFGAASIRAASSRSDERLSDEFFTRDLLRQWVRLTRSFAICAGAASLVVLLALCIAIPVYVLVPQGSDQASDAVVVLGPTDDVRLDAARAMISDGVSDTLVISSSYRADGEFATGECRTPQPFDVICFTARPFTTAGEIEAVATFGEELGWSRVTLITSTPHTTRVRVIAAECLPFDQSVVHVEAPRTASEWLLAFVYQTSAFAKMVARSPC